MTLVCPGCGARADKPGICWTCWERQPACGVCGVVVHPGDEEAVDDICGSCWAGGAPVTDTAGSAGQDRITDSAAQHWWMADCSDCEPRLPQPFKDRNERDEWADAHASATSHRVWRFVEPPYDL